MSALTKTETTKIFNKIYETNEWFNLDNEILKQTESKSGGGSTLKQTAKIIKELPLLFENLKIKRILDASCGDFNWMKHVNLTDIDYTGADIVPSVILNNKKMYTSANKKFIVLDILTDDLPKVDLILCRDCLVHFTYDAVVQAVKNFKKSGSKYLLTTTFTDRNRPNQLNLMMGHWHPYNLEKSPFNFPAPILIINENCTEADNKFTDKSLALWDLSKLNF